MVLERLAELLSASPRRERYGGLLAFASHGGYDLALFWPQTFMNEAGRAVSPARGALKVPLKRLVVVHDELDLPFGTVRTKFGGGLAGHNGLKSVAAGLGSRDFWRLRMGIGRPPTTDPEIVSAYVLSPFREDTERLQGFVGEGAQRLLVLVEEGGEARGA